MLKELLSDDQFFFVAIHAFLIGLTIGITISLHMIRNIKKKLKSQSKAYEELLESSGVELQIEPFGQRTKKPFKVVHLKEEYTPTAGMAV